MAQACTSCLRNIILIKWVIVWLLIWRLFSKIAVFLFRRNLLTFYGIEFLQIIINLTTVKIIWYFIRGIIHSFLHLNLIMLLSRLFNWDLWYSIKILAWVIEGNSTSELVILIFPWLLNCLYSILITCLRTMGCIFRWSEKVIQMIINHFINLLKFPFILLRVVSILSMQPTFMLLVNCRVIL